jgi:LacI family transcriptional regulator
VPDNSYPFFAEMARTIEDTGFAEGYSLILCNSDLSAVKQETYIDVLLAKRVDGLILTSSGLIPTVDGHDAVEQIHDAGAPCVVVDRDLGEAPVDQVLVDNDQGGYLAGEHLNQPRTPAHRLPRRTQRSDSKRRADRGVPPRTGGCRSGGRRGGIGAGQWSAGWGRRGGPSASRAGVIADGDVTAIFAFNDQMAIGAIGALQRAGRRAPEDISVIGFDDIPLSAAIFPALTTIAQPIGEMGAVGVRLLLDRIAGGRSKGHAPYQRVRLATRLVVRESMGPPAESVSR